MGNRNACSSNLFDKFATRLKLTENRQLVQFSGFGFELIFRFAGHVNNSWQPV
jgi:hypothetical protein